MAFFIHHMIPFYQIIVALGLRAPGTLLKRLRKINQNVGALFKHVSIHSKVSTPKHKMKNGKDIFVKR